MNGSKWVLGGRWLGVVLATVLVGLPLVWAGPSDDVQTEYAQRVARLKPGDLAGHYDLALWCKAQGAYELVRKQCTLILAQDGDHEQAKLLLKLAMRHLRAPEETERSGEPPRDTSGEQFGLLGRIISDEEIRRIRWMEMLNEEPRPLSIQFKSKVIQRFLEAMEGTAGFTTRQERRDFLRLKPTEKLQLIRKYTSDRFRTRVLQRDTGDQVIEDIIIKTDPKRMADFERRVLPPVLAGCATSNCHGNPEKSRFTLYTDRVMSKNKVYTNYLIMHRYRVGDQRLINRDSPLKSLLLTYGFRELPAALGNLDSSYKHPRVLLGPKKVEIKPIFRGVDDPKYQAIREWLESLSALEPDYGISLSPSAAGPRP